VKRANCELLVMQSPPAFWHFLSLRSRYFPWHPVLKNLQSVFFP